MKSKGNRRRMRGPRAALLPPLALAVLATGCGSAQSSSSTSSAATSATTTAGAAAGQTIEGRELDRFPPVKPPATLTLPPAPTAPKVERAYLKALFDDAQRVWRREFETAHMTYLPARLVIFWSVTQSPCGRHQEGAGPFYCPPRGVHLDTRFFTELLRIRGVGAAAQAYIVGHEIGHHVQRLVGIADRVNAANDADPAGRNRRSVQVELQADCLAGVWAHSAFPRSELTVTDLREALRTAEVIGDDYGTRSEGKAVDRTLFTHGSSEQRQRWLTTGFRGGRPGDCDTFTGR
jgi:predicted metalloprotease